MRKLATLFFLVLVASPVHGQERRPMTTDDGLNMVRVGGATISPDGSWVLFSKSELDWGENERKTTWWKVPAEGGEPFRFIGEEGGSSFQFSPDGTYVSFTRTANEKSQLFLLRTDGGEATQLSEHKTAIGSYRWSLDGSKIFFVAAEPRPEDEEKARKDGDDAIFVPLRPNQTIHQSNQHITLEGFHQIVSSTILNGFNGLGDLSKRGHQYHWDLWPIAFDLAEQLLPTHFGHFYIGEHKINAGLTMEYRQGFYTVYRWQGIEFSKSKRIADRFPEGCIVFDDEHSGLGVFHRSLQINLAGPVRTSAIEALRNFAATSPSAGSK